MSKRVPKITELLYKCQQCGFMCAKKPIREWGRSKTRQGSYGGSATPTPSAWYDEQYSATTISFAAVSGDTPAKINDSANGFADKHFRSEQPIKIETTSGTNDGTYTIAARGVSRGTLTLSSDDSLTTEAAATAGTVTISDVTYEPSIGTGCPFCGSLNSK
jgi:hypothetical protein